MNEQIIKDSVILRQPNLTTSQFSAWFTDDVTMQEMMSKMDGYKVSLRNKEGFVDEFNLFGFNTISRRTQVILLYKPKCKENRIMFYVPHDLSNKNRKRANHILETIKEWGDDFGIEMYDIGYILQEIITKHKEIGRKITVEGKVNKEEVNKVEVPTGVLKLLQMRDIYP